MVSALSVLKDFISMKKEFVAKSNNNAKSSMLLLGDAKNVTQAIESMMDNVKLLILEHLIILDAKHGMQMEFVKNVHLDIILMLQEYVHLLMIIVHNGKHKMASVGYATLDMLYQIIDVLLMKEMQYFIKIINIAVYGEEEYVCNVH